jgi:hypothetical protein
MTDMSKDKKTTELIIADHAIADPDAFTLGKTCQEIRLETRLHNRKLAVHMAAQGHKALRIFTRDLDPSIFDHKEFIAATKALAIYSRFSKVQILAFNSRKIAQRGHRLVELARKISSSIEIRKPEKRFESNLSAFMTVDALGYIYRKLDDRFEGICNYYDPLRAKELDKLFAEIWQHSQVDTEMRRLNI